MIFVRDLMEKEKYYLICIIAFEFFLDVSILLEFSFMEFGGDWPVSPGEFCLLFTGPSNEAE